MNEQGDSLFPICAELRTKKYYLLGRPPRTSAEVLDASNDCWCARTDDRIGPDKDPVHPDDCRRGRTCFQALLERPEALGGGAPRAGLSGGTPRSGGSGDAPRPGTGAAG